jgi:hypothetical protein
LLVVHELSLGEQQLEPLRGPSVHSQAPLTHWCF